MRKRILIIEDEPLNMKLFRELLQIAGYEVVEATDGKQGILMARKTQPDLILMDIQMPVMDGLEATRMLKKNEATRVIPILALTAHAMAGDSEKVFEAGCDGYITKPIDQKLFLNEIARYLSN